MSRLVPATLFLRDSWVQIPPPAPLISQQQLYFRSVKLVVDGIAISSLIFGYTDTEDMLG
jgi:hypothetical protein